MKKSDEGNVYYLHAGETDGTYRADLLGVEAFWTIDAAASENTFEFNYREGTLDPAGRMTLELTPFSQYK